MSRVFLYARISTDKQEWTSQEKALLDRFPKGTMVKEQVSGASKNKPALEELLRTVQKCDTIAVVALDRFGRRIRDLVPLLDDLYERGVNVISLRESIDYSTPAGRLVAHIMCAVAEMERNLIAERTKAALAAKQSQGIKLGRPGAPCTPEDVQKVKELHAQGYSYAQASKMVGVRRDTVRRLDRKLTKSA